MLANTTLKYRNIYKMDTSWQFDPLLSSDLPPSPSECPSPPPPPLLFLTPSDSASPSPTVLPAGDPQRPSDAPDKKRRQPARKLAAAAAVTPEKQQRKALRASKNRQFARESRERKLKYFAGLAKEVAVLRKELSKAKARMAEYELIERQRALSGEKGVSGIATAFVAMGRRNADISTLTRNIAEEAGRILDERRKALGQLTRMMLQIAVPLPVRLFMWEGENGMDIFNPASVARVMGYPANAREVKIIMASLQETYQTQENYQEANAVMRGLAQSVKKNVRILIDSQRGIQMEAMKLWMYIKEKLMPQFQQNRAAARGMQIVPRMEGRTELSDEIMFGVKEEDFLLPPREVEIANEKTEDKISSGSGSKASSRADERIKI